MLSYRTADAGPGSWDALAQRDTRSALRFGGDDIVLVWYFVWKRFGDPYGPPNRTLNCYGDSWVVKCRFSVKTDRIATQQSCALDDPDVALKLDHPFW
ncbi:hypothetical protein [Candidatus Phycosocius bacilliformis]|uniref:hypothetical protein n=1 Tax=Candidatus Phycosocius bacilliformis TaxID=1445552 RepID=UPI0011AB5EED|nr:hypothetical protein [Candidatus Phycosocius bacilliformis]